MARRAATCARGALQPAINLILQQLGRLIEQVHGCQPVRKPADHLVAAAAYRSEFAEVVEQRERVDCRKRIDLAGEKQRVERRRRLALNSTGHVGIRMCRHGVAYDVAVAAFFGVEPRQDFQRSDLGFIAAPYGGKRFQLRDHLVPLKIAER